MSKTADAAFLSFESDFRNWVLSVAVDGETVRFETPLGNHKNKPDMLWSRSLADLTIVICTAGDGFSLQKTGLTVHPTGPGQFELPVENASAVRSAPPPGPSSGATPQTLYAFVVPRCEVDRFQPNGRFGVSFTVPPAG